MNPLADHQREDHERPEFQCRNGKDVPDAFGLFVAAHDGGQKHQQKDGEEIFHHQPAEGHVAVVVCSALLSERTRVRTTVLATEMAMPKTAPAAHDQPKPCETTMPSKVAAPIWAAAPGRTIRWTASRSLRWKWRPTPNMSRMMPISAHWEAVSASATKPGE